MVKILNGKELAGFVKERQANVVKGLRAQGNIPKLVIIRDSDNPVITKYVELKKRYGEDIGVEVVDQKTAPVVDAQTLTSAKAAVKAANEDTTVSGIIVQLPITDKDLTDEIVNLIAPEKDVDGLNQKIEPGARHFESATATAINWLLSGYDIKLDGKKIALVGYGRLVGQPLERIFASAGFAPAVFQHNSDLTKLKAFDIIISATGVPHLITSKVLKPGAVVVDAGTASEDGVLVGDIDESVRGHSDLLAITPKIGGVGPLTVSVLFENVIQAAL